MVTEDGPTPLWDAVLWAHQRWTEIGRPEWDRLGLTVAEDGSNHIWVDQPANTIGRLARVHL